MKKTIVIESLKLVLLFAIYFITATFGLRLNAVSGFATLIWFPTGISLAAMMIFGYRIWPAIALGAFAANFINGAPFLAALGISIGNTLEALVGAYLLQRYVQFNPGLKRVRDVVGLLVCGAVISTLTSATIGVISLYMVGLVNPSTFAVTWGTWWLGDMISDLVTAPLLLVWSRKLVIKMSLMQGIERVCMIAFLFGIGFVIFRQPFEFPLKSLPFIYLVFPPLIWIALRFSPRGAASATFLIAMLAIWSTVEGVGPFVSTNLTESFLFLQSFMAVIAVTTLLLSSAMAERRILEKRKDNFIIFASHELKTPITSIKVYVQMLQKVFTKKQDKQVAGYLRSMDQQINKLTFLVNDFLDISKINSGNLELRKSKVLLSDLVRETVTTMQGLHNSHTIFVRGTVERPIHADKDRIGQVLSNLISNAVKYSPDGKKIIVSMSEQRNSVMISVQDFGIGIAKQHHNKVFEQFYRVDTKKNGVTGLGIGLYLSREIIRLHGGDITFVSRKGKGLPAGRQGTTFFVRVPYN